MAHRLLVKGLSALLIGGLLMHSIIASQAKAEQRQQIRFYKANSKGQTTRIAFTAKKGKREECQNLVTKRRIYQVNQFGFASCRLYASKNCAADSLISVKRRKDQTPVTELTQGYSWLTISEHKRGVKLRSWHCQGSASE